MYNGFVQHSLIQQQIKMHMFIGANEREKEKRAMILGADQI